MGQLCGGCIHSLTLQGNAPQKLADGIQYVTVQRLIRYRACQRHRADERTESQDSVRSCRTLVLAGKQTGDQLDIFSDLFGDEGAGSLSAACELPR
jgi:hypothetical protein